MEDNRVTIVDSPNIYRVLTQEFPDRTILKSMIDILDLQATLLVVDKTDSKFERIDSSTYFKKPLDVPPNFYLVAGKYYVLLNLIKAFDKVKLYSMNLGNLNAVVYGEQQDIETLWTEDYIKIKAYRPMTAVPDPDIMLSIYFPMEDKKEPHTDLMIPRDLRVSQMKLRIRDIVKVLRRGYTADKMIVNGVEDMSLAEDTQNAAEYLSSRLHMDLLKPIDVGVTLIEAATGGGARRPRRNGSRARSSSRGRSGSRGRRRISKR